jgi:hypothetical protein
MVQAGASARARARDGSTPAGVVGEGLQGRKRTSKAASADQDMRSWLGEQAADEEEEEAAGLQG